MVLQRLDQEEFHAIVRRVIGSLIPARRESRRRSAGPSATYLGGPCLRADVMLITDGIAADGEPLRRERIHFSSAI